MVRGGSATHRDARRSSLVTERADAHRQKGGAGHMERGLRRSHHMPFGAELTRAGHVRFRLWAPAARRVELLLYEGQDVQALAMPAVDGGFYELQCAQAR